MKREIRNIAKYLGLSLLSKGLSVSPLKLQKMLYYTQSWYMVFFGRENINPKIAKANPMIFHFALDPSCKIEANRLTGLRNARIYFMVGYNGMIHPLFFDPYHELNPVG